MFDWRKEFATTALIATVIVFAGCATQNLNATRPEMIAAPQVARPQPAMGSIWQGESANNMIFSDKKARYPNDIVTIIVSETASGGNKASTTTSKNTNTSAALTSFFGVENAILNNNATMGGKIGLGGQSSNTLKGDGDTSRKSTLEARISARVMKVLDNGHLLIEGRRQVTVNAEDQYIIISGIIRPDDINADNTVASQYIADARIIYTGEGVINDKMRPGWLTRLVDWIWPF